MQEADVLDRSSLGAPLLLIWEVNFVVNLGPTMVSSLAVPRGGGGQAQVACPLPVHSGKAAGGPAGGFLVTVVILFFNILLSKVLKVQEARWRPDNIVLLVPS